MANVVVIGSQWGDEGKGKIVDWLSLRADVVARFQGGHNAGHTLVINGEVYKLSLLPSGIVREGKLSVIGNGVLVDPWALFSEIETLRGQGVTVSPENLKIAENATLILPLHQELDAARENANAGVKIGTTKRGIGPAGPMPRLVVPILTPALAFSRAASNSWCNGKISVAFSAIFKFSGETVTPCPRNVSISEKSAQGSTNTPLPMTDSLPSRTMPDGKSDSLYTSPLMTSV